MTQRTFVVSLILLAVAVVLSATSLGGVIAFLLAIMLLIFISLPASFIAKTLNLGEFLLTGYQFIAILAAFYALFLVVSAVQAWRQRNLDKARSVGFGVAVLAALPLMGWLSIVYAWR